MELCSHTLFTNGRRALQVIAKTRCYITNWSHKRNRQQ